MNELLKNIKEIVLQEDAQASIILFGSRARGDNHSTSDWDILVLNSEKVKADEFQKIIRAKTWEIEKETGEAINLIFCNKTEWIVKLGTSLFFKKVNEEGLSI